MQRYIDLTPAEQNEVLIQTSAARGISPLLLEKDFWVCWLLNKIFRLSFAQHLIFKGGTSLSKCYGLINRFSEDCDITLDKSLFSDVLNDPDLSGKEFQRQLEQADKNAVDFIHHSLKENLEELIAQSFQTHDIWHLLPDEKEPKNLRFFYPAVTFGQESNYIRQSVLLEFGIRGDMSPWEEKTVISYTESHFSTLLASEKTSIRTLLPIRTFWEKITLIHAENHRPYEKTIGERVSRHYYDLYQMICANVGEEALKHIDLLHDVIAHKNKFFRAGWANYDSSIPGQIKLFRECSLNCVILH